MAGDVIAGVTLWAVFAAQALAYARLAHATSAAGLVTAIAGAAVYSVLGSSRRISIGPAGGIAAMVGAAVVAIPTAKLASSLAVLTLLAAGFLFAAGIARISFLTRLFPTPVFVGYIAGTGVTILFGQARDLVSSGRLALVVGLAAIALVLSLRRLAPKLPGPFVVLLAATLASVALGLGEQGVPVIGGSLGHFGAPALPTGLAWSDVKSLLGPAASLALVVYVDVLANGDMLAAKGDPPLNPRREYFALGATNLLAGFAGGFVAGCSTSRSLIGIRAGEKSRIAGLIAAGLLVLTALSVVRFLQPMPLAALAGVVLVAATDLVNVERLREFWRLRRADFWIAVAAGAGVVFAGMLKGVVIGVGVALAEALRRAMYPDRSLFTVRLGKERFYEPFTPDAIRAAREPLVYRFGAALFFGNADVFVRDMRDIAALAAGKVHTVIVNAGAMGIPDATARDALLKAQAELARRGIRLVFGNVRAALRGALTEQRAFTLIDEREFVASLRKLHPAPL